MGVKQLKSFLQNQCSSKVHHVHLSIAANKTIVVDTSIYAHEFLRQERFDEGFRAMLDLFRQHNIRPIFVFDGKMPKEKRQTIRRRQDSRAKAQLEYAQLTSMMPSTAAEKSVPETSAVNPTEPLQNKMQDKQQEERIEKLRSQLVSVTTEQNEELREWLLQNNVDCIVAEGEADVLCSQMVMEGKAWACMSNDTDMFLYSCPRILSDVCWFDAANATNTTIYNTDNSSPTAVNENKENKREKGSCTYYVLQDIIKELNMDLYSFVQMLVLSGSEYVDHLENMNIYKIYRKWEVYLNYVQRYYYYLKSGPPIPFCLWFKGYLKIDDSAEPLFQQHIHMYQKIISWTAPTCSGVLLAVQ